MTKGKKYSTSFAMMGLLVVSMLLAACDTSGGGGTTAGSATNTPVVATTSSPTAASGGSTGGSMSGTVMLGAALSLSAAAKPYGDSQSNAIKLAMDEINANGGINGKTLTIDIQDDASDPKQAGTVYQKFISDKVVAIIGPTLSNSAKTADPLAQQAKIPVLAVSNTADGVVTIGDYIYRDSLSEQQVIPYTISVTKEKLGLKKVAIIYGDDDAFTKSGYDVFKKALADNGIEVTTEQTFKKGTTDFSAQITAIKGSNPDAIVSSALIAEAEGIVTEARSQGLTLPIIGGNGFNSTKLIADLKDKAEGVYVGAAWNAGGGNQLSQDFVKNYTAKFSKAPDQFAAQAYTGVYILADALKRAKSMSGADVLDALKTTKITTVLGDFSFLDTRDANHTPVVQVVKGGQFEVVK